MRFTKPHKIKSHRAPFPKCGHSNTAFPTSCKWSQAPEASGECPAHTPKPRVGLLVCHTLPSRTPWAGHSPGLSLPCPATDSLCQSWQDEKWGGKREGFFLLSCRKFMGWGWCIHYFRIIWLFPALKQHWGLSPHLLFSTGSAQPLSSAMGSSTRRGRQQCHISCI